ncbi:hypothetical protein EZV62_000496 [Acer yangbiense]|uniref:Uncharacterized protein n=1 Tax=Acer yangbiense TaxID=1000413 RepID=A0A5C7IR97_9ROSI|nr:hypothetical protein EZV62_000496 [Acer yangbiense]
MIRTAIPVEGDWEEGKCLIEEDLSMVHTAITEHEYDTALHVATKAEQTGFALRIMVRMNRRDLTLQNQRGDTAFCLAVATGNMKLAHAMFVRNTDLATIRDSWNITPFNMAVVLGKFDMADFLCCSTKDLTTEEQARIFFQSLTDLYDIGKSMLVHVKELAVTCDIDGDTALHVLA